jgi:hypothetical protein
MHVSTTAKVRMRRRNFEPEAALKEKCTSTVGFFGQFWIDNNLHTKQTTQ